ncbi:MAG: glycosyltransferase [Planctomycetes bacterium]|nr:glycosyltransferase [Planctomycetota bacterium]
MRILVFSSYARDTGSWVRMFHLAKSLERYGRAELVAALPRCLPLRLDLALSLPWYLARALLTRADVLIAGKPFPNTALPLLLARWLRGKTIVLDFDDLDHGYVSGLAARLIAAAQKPFPRRFDLVTYHHDALRAFLGQRLGVPEKRLYQLAQGVDLERFRPAGPPAAAAGLFFMGHLDAASNLATILEAVAIVQQTRDVELTVVGGGRLEGAFRAMAKAARLRVRFTGWLPVARAARELERAAVCLVYHAETEANAHRCSMKLREYLAAAKKVVSNDHGELARFTRFTYQSSSGAAPYARAIVAALDGSDGREHAGARHIRQTCDWAVLAARFHERLAELHGRRQDAGRPGAAGGQGERP